MSSSRYQISGQGARALLPHLAPHSLTLSGVQELQQLSEPGESPGPLTALQWDEVQQLNNVNELLSPLCGLLLEEKPPRVAASAAHAGPVGKAGFSLTPRSYPHPPVGRWGGGVRDRSYPLP